MNIKKMTLAMACILSAYAGVAAAATPTVDNITTVHGDVTFTQPSNTVAGIITPVSGLLAMPLIDNTKVASITVAATGATPVLLAYQPTAGKGTIVKKGTAGAEETVTYNGTTTNANTLTLSYGHNQTTNKSVMVGTAWWVTSAAATKSITDDIVLAGDQTVKADTYTISVDVGEYHA